MANSYKFSLRGLSSDVQFGQGGGRLVWNTDHFESTSDGSTLAQLRVPTTPVDNNDAASKAYVDSAGGGGITTIRDGGVDISTTNTILDLLGSGISAVDSGGGVTSLTVNSSTGVTNQMFYRETLTTTGGTQIDIDVTGVAEVILIIKRLAQSSAGFPTFSLSPDGGTTISSGFVVMNESGSSQGGSGVPPSTQSAVGLGGNVGGTLHHGILQIGGLSEAQNTHYRSFTASGNTDVEQRWGWMEQDVIHDTIRLAATAGTFSAVDVDVYVRMSSGANSALLQTLDASVSPSSSLEFLNLDGYDTVTILFEGLRKTSDSAARAFFQVSTDNGATWLSTNEYGFVRGNDGFSDGSAGSNALAVTLGNSGSNTWSGKATFHHLNGDCPKAVDGFHFRSDGGGETHWSGYVDTASKVNAIRITHPGFATNYDLGTVRVIGGAVAVDAAATVGAGTGTQPYDVSFFYPLQALPSVPLLDFNVVRSIELPDDFTGSFGNVVTNPTASYVMSVERNSVAIGTITISTGGVFTFATTGAGVESFVAGDLLTVRAPSLADATLQDVSVTLIGSRV